MFHGEKKMLFDVTQLYYNVLFVASLKCVLASLYEYM